MRKEEKTFYSWVKASPLQLTDYEEAKNKDYTRDFKGNLEALHADFRRQNYFLPKTETFQTKRDRAFTEEEIADLKLKIRLFSKSEQLGELIQAIGGQALQAPLNVLEFLNFHHEGEKISAIAKFDLSLYFHCEEDLHYINLNFCYAMKNTGTDKNYFFDAKLGQLIEISDKECQLISTVLNALSNDVQRHLGKPIKGEAVNLEALPGAEKLAAQITQSFKFPERLNWMDFMSFLEKEIALLIRESLGMRRAETIWKPEFLEESEIFAKMEKKCFSAILGGADHMIFNKQWKPLEVQLKEDQSLKLRESIFPHSELSHNWERSILRDLLATNTRAIQQRDLILFHNSKEINNHLDSEPHPSQAIFELKKTMDFHARDRAIRKIFQEAWSEELQSSRFIRDQVPAKTVKKGLKYLSEHLQNPLNRRDLSDGEFLQWSDFACHCFFENLRRADTIQDLRVRNFYKAQFWPRIDQERDRLIAKRRKFAQRILKMDLNTEEIMKFSRDLVRQSSQIFSRHSSFYDNIRQAFCALFSQSLRSSVDSGTNIDEIIYRLFYIKAHDSINAAFIEILLFEAIHCKIREENKWALETANLFRAKSPEYQTRVLRILEKMQRKMEIQIHEQEEERKKALTACEEIRLKSAEFLRSEDSEDNISGLVMKKLAEDLSQLARVHYKNHYYRDLAAIPKDRVNLIAKVNGAIDSRISSEEALRSYEGLGAKIKNYVLNFLVVVFTLGVFPLTRKFILNKPAFFGSVKNEIVDETRVILSKA